MTDEWIWLWVKCLSLNKVYEEYCTALSISPFIAGAIETEHPSITDVYHDFGVVNFPLLSPTKKGFSKQWHKWLDEHRHLFYPTTITIGRKSTTTEPKYKLSLTKRSGAYQMRAARKRLMAYTVLGARTGKARQKKYKGKVQPITTTLFAELAIQQTLWKDDFSDWGGARRLNYKQLTLKLVKQAEQMIAGTIEGRFPVVTTR